MPWLRCARCEGGLTPTGHDCDWVVSRSEIKRETAQPTEDIRAVGQPKGRRGRSSLSAK